ncbi:Rare lipoprotein A precursor [Candidatus Liberibacter solanacearum]|uniref:Endolytic peptidoglycan transglycosylase RlpA n=2 Tax=Candidatus Liberibacter solanacearum TaxID=556287 RepID=A0A0F4VLS8_9HYPH|nr:septal ring lytic transglycosylase RlpA family protein [Candidatus Liberibacter solanacearum]KJZ82468.1 Rare lipoprotein A precursor [Candidatus Liberibacter solanacearum]
MARFSFSFFGRMGIISITSLGMSSCFFSSDSIKNSYEYFPESKYGVSASDRIFFGKRVPRGGGRYLLGKPYQIRGRQYIPRQYISYAAVGMASWYGKAFHGRLTANGEIYGTEYITAAHPTLPLPSYVRVTNLENGISLVVRVNDRGPYHDNRLIDLSNAAAKILHIEERGVAKVHVQYLGMASLSGTDQGYLKSMIGSYTQKMSLPLGCQYVEEIVKIPYLLTRRQTVSLSNCDDNSLRRQNDISLGKKTTIPIPTENFQSKKPRINPSPSRSSSLHRVPIPSPSPSPSSSLQPFSSPVPIPSQL